MSPSQPTVAIRDGVLFPTHTKASAPMTETVIDVLAKTLAARSCAQLVVDYLESIRSIERFANARWLGYQITTTQRQIEVRIDADTRCCESFGIDTTWEDLAAVHGSVLQAPDLCWGPEPPQEEGYCRATALLHTSAGTIVFRLWNNHNGYYSHDIQLCFGDGRVDSQHL